MVVLSWKTPSSSDMSISTYSKSKSSDWVILCFPNSTKLNGQGMRVLLVYCRAGLTRPHRFNSERKNHLGYYGERLS